MKKTMKPAKVSFAGCLALTMTLVAPLPKQAHAQACYAEPYSKNRNFVQVSIDTHGMEGNALLSDVSVEVSYRAGSNEAKKGLQFTDSSIRTLHADQVYRRYFDLNEGPDIKILGGSMSYVQGVAGETFDTGSIRKNLSSGKAPDKALVVGSMPPAVELSLAAAEVMFNIAGDWRFTTHSDTSGETHNGNVTLHPEGSSVRGTIETWDQSNGVITGSYDASTGTLTLSRNTGLETTQKYNLSRDGDIFSGKFWNEGKYADSGSIKLVRPQPTAPSGMGADVH